MKFLIHKYLSRNYALRENYLCKSIGGYVRGEDLLNELETIFGLSKKNLKWYLKSWFLGQSKSFPFNRYWASVIGNISFNKKLNITWSPELARDLAALHGIDVEEELASYLNQNIDPETVQKYSTRQVNPAYYTTITLNLEN